MAITALGAAGSVVGIADVAFQLVKSISKAYTEIASTEVVLRTITDEVDSMGTALSQISNLVHVEEQNVKDGQGLKLFTETALSDVRKTAEKCLIIFWRIEGTILERAGTSDFEKEIQTRRAEFRRQAGGKGKGVGAEFRLTEGLADAATSFFRRTKWQLKGTLPKLREYCDQLRGFQLVFTVMLATISLQTSRRNQDWNAIVVALTKINMVDQETSISDVLAYLYAVDQKGRLSASHTGKGENTRISQVDQSSQKEHLHLRTRNQPSKDVEPHLVQGISRDIPVHPHSDKSEKPLPGANHPAATISKQANEANDHIRVTEDGTEVSAGSTEARSQQKVGNGFQEADSIFSSDGRQPHEVPLPPSSDGKPALDGQSERIGAQQEPKAFGSPSINHDCGKVTPDGCLGIDATEKRNDSDASLDRGRVVVKEHVPAAHFKAPQTSIPAPNRNVSSKVGTIRDLDDPKEIFRSKPDANHDSSPNIADLCDLGRTKEPSKRAVGSGYNVSSVQVPSNNAKFHNPDGTIYRSRLVFIVKEGLAQPTPQLSSQGLDRSFRSRFNLRSPRDLDYRKFAFLDDLDRKAIESLLEDVKPSKQASVQMRILKNTSFLSFGKAKSAVLVIIEEPGKSLNGQKRIGDGTSDSGGKAKSSSESARDGEMSDEEYIQELTTYKAVSIHPLMDVRRSKTSVHKVEWDQCVRAEVTLDRAETLRRLTRIDKDGLSVASKRRSLNSQQRLQVHTALVEATRTNTDKLNFEFTIRQLELIKKRIRLWSLTPVTLAIVVYLQRSPISHSHLKSLFEGRHFHQSPVAEGVILGKLKAEEDKKQREQEEAEREYAHRLTDQLRASGLPEDQIKAILEKRRINPWWGAQPRPFPAPMPVMPGPGRPPPMPMPMPMPPPPPPPVPQPTGAQMPTQMTTAKTTYTRMARRHLSLECLKARGIDFELDSDPDYVLIKRWVSPEERKELWSLTKVIRDGREKVTTTLAIEDRSHHHHSHKLSDEVFLTKDATLGGQYPDEDDRSPSSSRSRATGTLESALLGVDKDIINLLLRRWTPGIAELSPGSEGGVSEDGEDTEVSIDLSKLTRGTKKRTAAFRRYQEAADSSNSSSSSGIIND